MPRALARANSVVLVLVATGLVALFALDLATIQPNRIVAGTGHGLTDALGPLGAGLVSLPLWVGLILAWRPAGFGERLMLVLALIALAGLPWGVAALGARFIEADAGTATRISIAAGTWVVAFTLLLLLIELRRRAAPGRGIVTALWIVPLASLAAALGSGALDRLALVREYAVRREEFVEAIGGHLLLVGGAVGFSLLAGFALALLMRRLPRLQKGVFGVLSFIQTIPSLALFGLLLAPLAWLAASVPALADLGVSGIGRAPALIALVGYSLLPMTRNTFVALAGVDPDVIESARGMGMSPAQVFLQVRLPLALPVLLEGVRITTVQAIGLAAVAALIGAGGLGAFIFQGLGQAAMNLVMLGALPIIAMALVVDAALKALADRLRRGEAVD